MKLLVRNLGNNLGFSLQTTKIIPFKNKLAVNCNCFLFSTYRHTKRSPLWCKRAASSSREMMDCCHYRSSAHVITVLPLSSRVKLEEEKSAINSQETGRLYCLSSRAQTCCGHPVRPLLFLSPVVEEDDDDEDDEVV